MCESENHQTGLVLEPGLSIIKDKNLGYEIKKICHCLHFLNSASELLH